MKIGFDFGGSLIKVSLACEEEEVDKLGDFKDRITHQFIHHKIIYINGIFKRNEFPLFCKFIKEIKKYLNQLFVVCTGGGVVDKNKELIELFDDIDIEPLSEFKSIIDGVSNFAKVNKNFIFSIDEDFKKTVVNIETLHPFLLANIGTGISINRLDKDSSTYLCGTTLGGSSLLGFSNAVQKDVDFEEIMNSLDAKRAEEEILFEQEYEKIMNGEIINKQEDLNSMVSSFSFEIINNICDISFLLAKQNKIRHVLFIGNFLKNNTMGIKRINENFSRLSKKYGCEIEVC